MLRLCHSTLRAGTRRALPFLSAILLASACSDDGDVTAPVPAVPTVAGTVMTSATGDPVAGAEVSIGAATATTGADGRFELTGLAAGTATLRCTAPGFEDFEMNIMVPSGTLTRDILLTPASLQILGGMNAQAQVFISIARAGRSVTDATVKVNEVAIPHAGEGSYEGALPDAIPAGSPFVLHVSADGMTVEATGNVPDVPVLTAPVTGSVFGFGDSIPITWTSTTDPDFFTGPFGPTSGEVRGARIAASDIACDFTGPLPDPCLGLESDVTRALQVSAVRDLFGHRDFTGPAAQNSSFTIESASSPAVLTVKPAAVAPVGIFASIGLHNLLGPWVADVYVSDAAGRLLTNAVVTVNGVAMPLVCPFDCVYGGELPEVSAGSPLDLVVRVGGVSVTATGTVPETPILTGPAGGTAFTLNDSITITWASATDPDGFDVHGSTDSAGADLGTASGTARELKFAASTIGNLRVGSWQISVHARNEGSFTGPVHPDPASFMSIQSGRAEVPITITQ